MKQARWAILRNTGGVLLAALWLLLAAPAWADPALWAARGPHATVFLFGSIHVLRPGQAWLSDRIRQAFAAAGSCWFEVDQADMQPEAVEAALRVGMDPGHKLSDLLTPAERTRLAAAVTRIKLPGGMATVEPMRPWLAAAMLAAADVAADGYSSENGVDATLLKLAQAANKPVHGLETAAEQVRGLSTMPQAAGLKMLRDVLKNDTPAKAAADTLADAWARGDVAGLAATIRSDGKADDEALMAAVFKTRNQAWAARIADLVAKDESAFVTVGAGHLVGPGNLREVLAARGITLERVEP